MSAKGCVNKERQVVKPVLGVCFAHSAPLTTTACVGVVAWKQLRSWKETAGRMTLT